MAFHRLPQQLSMAALSVLPSLPHTAEVRQTSPCDAPGCNPPQKHKPAIYYKNFSAGSEQIPALCKLSRVMQPSQPLLSGLEMQKGGVPRGMEITNIEGTDLVRGLPKQGSCSHSISQENSMALLCIWGAWQTRREFSTNVKSEKKKSIGGYVML